MFKKYLLIVALISVAVTITIFSGKKGYNAYKAGQDAYSSLYTEIYNGTYSVESYSSESMESYTSSMNQTSSYYHFGKSSSEDSDPYDANSFNNEEDFYEYHYYDFFDYYDAENYYNEHTD